MVVRLVQEVVDELGAEVMVSTPVQMADVGCDLAVTSGGGIVEIKRRLGLCGFDEEVKWIDVHLAPSERNIMYYQITEASPTVLLVVGEVAAHTLGFNHPMIQLASRTAIYWQDTHTRRGCFVLFLPEPDARGKSWWLSQIYKAERYLSGEQSPWDEIGRGPCMGTRIVPTNHYPYQRQVGCSHGVAWLDQWGLPWCQGHKTLPEKPKTKARRKERVR